MKNLLKLSLVTLMTLSLNSCNHDDDSSSAEVSITVTDVNGNNYQTVTIGAQVWTTTNFKATQLNDGTPIELFDFTPNDNDWFDNSRTSSMYVKPSTSDLSNMYPDPLPEDFYGYVYSRGAINSGKLAPAGWRVPTLADFQTLRANLSATYGAANVSTSLRSQTDWFPNDLTSNLSNFTALPNGYCTVVGNATGAPAIATFMTRNEISATDHNIVQLIPSENDVLIIEEDSRFCGGVRLIQE
nr:FISUMP domain-containing protein [Nonlabens ulvanivorans]